MKKYISLLCITVISLNLKAQSPTITYTNLSGANQISCNTPSLNFVASVNNYTNGGTFVFNWVSGNASLSGTNVSVSSPGVYSLVAINATNNFTISTTFGIISNTTAPITSVAPLTQNIVCGGAAATFTGTSNISNVTHAWTSSYSSGSAIGTGLTSNYSPTAIGVFTYCVTDNNNGCSTCKTVTVTSAGGFPTFSATSSSQFMVGCGAASVTSIYISGANTNPIPGGAVSYTVLPPGYTGPSNPGTAPVFTANIPGTYTIVVRDNINNCETKVPVSVIQNTTSPIVTISAPTQTLTCYTPGTRLTASSGTNVSFLWTTIFIPPTIPSYSIPVYSNTVNTTNTIVATFTLTVTDNSNNCKSILLYTVYQDVRKPVAIIGGGFNGLTCITPSVLLTNNSNGGQPGPNPPFIMASAWYGPAPQPSLANSSTYQAYTPGTYTMIALNLNNGCTTATTTIVMDNVIYPVLTAPSTLQFNCIDAKLDILVVNVNSLSPISYTWSGPSIVTPANQGQITVAGPGIYTVVGTNAANGCSSALQVIVNPCAVGLDENLISYSPASVFPNPFNDQLTIEFNALQKNTTFEIYSALGVMVKKQVVTAEKTIIDLQNEPSGIYFVYVLEGQKAIKTAKIVKN